MTKTIYIARPVAALIKTIGKAIDIDLNVAPQAFTDAASARKWLEALADKADVANKWTTKDGRGERPISYYQWLDQDDATVGVYLSYVSNTGMIGGGLVELGSVEEVPVYAGQEVKS